MSKKYPLVLQNEIKDCGAASLLMVIRFYKGDVSLSYLYDLMKTTKSGTTAYHLRQAAIELGFHATGYRVTFDSFLVSDVVLPCISLINVSNSYQHYIVVYEINIKKEYILVGDPADKIKKVSFEEARETWGSFILVLYPLKVLPVYSSSRNQMTQFISSFLKKQKNILIQMIFLSLFVIIFEIITSTFLQILITFIQEEKPFLLFLLFASIYIALYFLKNISNYFRNFLLIWLNQNFDYFFTNGIFRNIILLPYQYYCNRTTGDILSRIQDLNVVRNTVSKIFLILFIDFPLSLVALFILYFVHPKLCFISVVVFIIYILIYYFFQKLLYEKVKVLQRKRGENTSYMVESISGFKSVKGCHLEHEILRKFERNYYEQTKIDGSYHYLYNIEMLVSDLLYDFVIIVILVVGSKSVLEGTFSLGNLIFFYSLSGFFFGPARNIIDFNQEIKEASSALIRISEIFYPRKEIGIMNIPMKGDIKVSNLDFSFNDRDMVLSRINFTILEGSKVAVVGKSGSGKSTLFQLLMRYYSVERGKIVIANVDINDYKEECVRNNICYVSNQETLFTDTLYYNITMGQEYDNFSKVTKACLVDDIIKKQNLGYQMIVEENGFNFSSGERQRIILARTLLRPFEILIIDEGLSHVDVNMERKILKNLFKMFSDKIIIIITHRKENLDLFDQFIEIESGKVKDDVRKNK